MQSAKNYGILDLVPDKFSFQVDFQQLSCNATVADDMFETFFEPTFE